ncbi:hypothetical protein KF840_09130 [bacterium]|nr:hypothetical protein [bacterium]
MPLPVGATTLRAARVDRDETGTQGGLADSGVGPYADPDPSLSSPP